MSATKSGSSCSSTSKREAVKKDEEETQKAQSKKRKRRKAKREREGPRRASQVAGSSGSELRPKRSAFAALATSLSYEVAEQPFSKTIDRVLHS